jgi:hypothetical protein
LLVAIPSSAAFVNDSASSSSHEKHGVSILGGQNVIAGTLTHPDSIHDVRWAYYRAAWHSGSP